MIDFLKIPFKKFGRDYSGCDCYGLVLLYYKDKLGITLPDFSPKNFNFEEIQSVVLNAKQYFEPVIVPQKNDIAIMHFEGLSCHVGVMLSSTDVLHVLENETACCESLIYSHRLRGRKIEYVRPK